MSSDSVEGFDRGASTMVGYVMMFSILLLGGFVILASGGMALSEQTSETVSERSLTEMSDLRSDYAAFQENYPYRDSTFSTRSSTVYYADAIRVDVEARSLDPSVDDSDILPGCVSNGNWCLVASEVTRPIGLTDGNNVLHFMSGALLVAPGDDPERIDQPWFWELTDDDSQIPIYKIEQNSGASSLGGASEVEVSSYLTNIETTYWETESNPSSNNLEIRVTIDNTDHPEGWRSYFQESSKLTDHTTATQAQNGKVVATFTTDSIVVRAFTLKTQLNSGN